MKTRCSSLPLVEKCPAAANAPALCISSDGEEANLGTAVHEVILGEIAGKVLDTGEIADRYQVDFEELGHLVGAARKIWNDRLHVHFPSPRVEVFLQMEDGDFQLTGHADVLAIAGDMLLVLDWKSGFLDQDHTAQLLGYALLGLRTFPECQQVYTAIARIRDVAREPIDAAILTRAEVESWWIKFKANTGQAKRFSPGAHCRFCPRGHECPARARLLKNALAIFTNQGAAPKVGIGEIYDAIKLLRDALEEAYGMVKSEVEVCGGSLSLEDGRQLYISEEKRTKIHFGPGQQILREAVGDDQLGQAVNVSKSKIVDMVRRQAPHGGKQAAVDEFLGALDKAGALSQTVTRRLEARYAKPAQATCTPAHQRQGG